MKLKKLLKKARTEFGNVMEIPMPEGCNVIIVCSNSGCGLNPRALLLPHQLYEKDLKDYLDNGDKELVVIPAKSKDYVKVAVVLD